MNIAWRYGSASGLNHACVLTLRFLHEQQSLASIEHYRDLLSEKVLVLFRSCAVVLARTEYLLQRGKPRRKQSDFPKSPGRRVVAFKFHKKSLARLQGFDLLSEDRYHCDCVHTPFGTYIAW